jgi:pimeloyl-ACP methyl ester carboxylesterase
VSDAEPSRPVALRAPEPFTLEGSDGGPLRADHYRPDDGAAKADRAVLLCHGFRGYKDWGFLPLLASRLADAGFPAVAFSASSSGVTDRAGTFGEPERFRRGTYGGDLEDLDRVADWAQARFASRGAAFRLGLAGHSRGGVIALLHAARDARVAAVATLASPERIGVWPEPYWDAWRAGEPADVYDFRTRATLRLGPPIYGDWTRNRDAYDTRAAAARLRAPLLVVHGTRDALVPLEEARALVAMAPPGLAQLRVVEGAGHSFQAGDELRRTPPPQREMIESGGAGMRRGV